MKDATGGSAARDNGHSGEARLTPHELVFGEPRFEMHTFPSLQTEADTRGVDPADPDRFAFLSVAGDTVREVIPTDAGPEAIEQYRLFLYHAFNFWRFGKRLYLLEPPVARFLVEAAPRLSGWEVHLPAQSTYVQLPSNLFWATVAPDLPPEPVDGFFATCVEVTDAFGREYQRLECLLVLGIRRRRAGLSLIPFKTEIIPGTPPGWTELSDRDGVPAFQSDLPGGELAGLYSVVTLHEALTLVGRALWYVDRHPGAISSHDASERLVEDRPGSPPLSRLPFYRVALGEEERPSGAGGSFAERE